MTSDERRDISDSLADQAAAWVPPWARQAATPANQPSEEPAGSADPAAAVEPTDSANAAAVVDTTGSAEAAAAGDSELPDTADQSPIASDQASVESEPGPLEPAEPVPNEDHGEVWPWPPAESRDTAPAGAPTGPAGSPTGPTAAAPEAGPAPAPAPGAPAVIDDDELRGALEAILLVVDEPVAEIVLAQVLEQPTDRVAAMLGQLVDDYAAAGHGFELRRAAGGWRLYTRPEYATYVERFVLNGQAVRLTQAALETLAVVAYKQPVTRSRISAIRGVNCDGVIRTLVSRGLVEECGTEPDSGAFLYRTTTLFLEKLGLNTVDELPPLAPFLPDDLEEIADAPR
jgi:segregation and condensation protein B